MADQTEVSTEIQEVGSERSTLHTPDDSPLSTLSVFKDVPLFADVDSDSETDAFNHSAFADTIAKLIDRNPPPLSIGLFGAWGIGKSTIINILFGKLRANYASRFKPIYFNAWKFSGDSFRRQFLIETARQIYEDDDHEEVARLRQLSYADVLKSSYQKNFLSAVLGAIKDTSRLRFALRSSAVARFLLGCVALLLAAALSAALSGRHPVVSTLILTTVGPAVFVWLSQIKFEDLFVFQEAPLYDPKMIFPEQFAAEFARLIRADILRGRKAVIAVDDLDRCEPKVVQDVLLSMKNFIGEEECFFIIPCDDKTIVSVFTEPNQKQGYADESLRKYFNVVLRIPPITSTDLVDFANTVARKTRIPEDVVQVAVLANCRDARKMKHFLNSLAMKYQIAKARESAGLMPKIVDESLLELAKAVLIEDAYPDLFGRIVENPRVYQVLERAALGAEDETGELKSLGLEAWNTDYHGLKQVLERTRDIRMTHADVFFSLKSTNPEVKIPRGTELKNAIIGGDLGIVEEISKGITDGSARTATADLLVDLLNRGTGRFLQRSIAGALKLYSAELFSENDTRRVATAVSGALLYRDGIDILAQDPASVLRSAEQVGEQRLSEVIDKYDRAVTDLKQPVPQSQVLSLIPAVYAYPAERKRFSGLFNDKFGDWISTREGLVALRDLKLPSDLPQEERIPSKALAEKLLAAVAPEASETVNNGIRRDILFSDWSPDFAATFGKSLAALLVKSQNLNEYAPELRFVIESINLKLELVKSAESNQLWPPIPAFYSRITNAEAKGEMGKAAVGFAILSGDANVRTAARNFVLEYSASLSDPALRGLFAFMQALGESSDGDSLTRAVIDQELNFVIRDRQSPSERLEQRVDLCIEYAETLAPKALENALVDSLDVSQEQALTKWLKIIADRRPRFGSEFSERLATRCLELVRANSSQRSRAEMLLKSFLESLTTLSVEKIASFSQGYFDLLKDPNTQLRDLAAALLPVARTSVGEPQEFRIKVGNLLGDIERDMSTAELLPRRPVIEALIGQADLFGDSEWRDMADLAIRCLSQTDPALQEFGLSLVERVGRLEVVPESSIDGLIHLLIGLENSAPALRERVASQLERLASGHLSESARSELLGRQNSGASSTS